MKHARLFGLALALIFALTLLAKAEDKIVSRIVNLPRIVRAWNSIGPATQEWNAAIQKADALLHERFNPRIVVVDPEGKRRETVANYKAAREALLKELEALNELIDEEED